MDAKKIPTDDDYIDPTDYEYFTRKHFQKAWAFTFPDHPKGEDNFKRDTDGLYSDPVVRAAYAMWKAAKEGTTTDTSPKRTPFDYTRAESLYISQRAGVHDENGNLTQGYMDWATWAPSVSEFRFDYKQFIFVVVRKGIHRGTGVETWAVQDTFGSCLSIEGEWVTEPSPSSRTNKWLAEHRFTDFASACAAGKKAFEEMVAEYERPDPDDVPEASS